MRSAGYGDVQSFASRSKKFFNFSGGINLPLL